MGLNEPLPSFPRKRRGQERNRDQRPAASAQVCSKKVAAAAFKGQICRLRCFRGEAWPPLGRPFGGPIFGVTFFFLCCVFILLHLSIPPLRTCLRTRTSATDLRPKVGLISNVPTCS